MPAAARIGDSHVCAHHVGGKVITGCPTVLIGDALAARSSDIAECAGPQHDAIESGCATVFIGCQPAARLLDATDGGHLTSGEATVQIGSSLSPAAVKRAIRKLRRHAGSGQ